MSIQVDEDWWLMYNRVTRSFDWTLSVLQSLGLCSSSTNDNILMEDMDRVIRVFYFKQGDENEQTAKVAE